MEAQRFFRLAETVSDAIALQASILFLNSLVIQYVTVFYRSIASNVSTKIHCFMLG
jgi:hypothetical protein